MVVPPPVPANGARGPLALPPPRVHPPWLPPPWSPLWERRLGGGSDGPASGRRRRRHGQPTTGHRPPSRPRRPRHRRGRPDGATGATSTAPSCGPPHSPARQVREPHMPRRHGEDGVGRRGGAPPPTPPVTTPRRRAAPTTTDGRRRPPRASHHPSPVRVGASPDERQRGWLQHRPRRRRRATRGGGHRGAARLAIGRTQSGWRVTGAGGGGAQPFPTHSPSANGPTAR
ncbi:hypothetical protein BU14_0312s0009 [Porphyra umbilicalis]|uniref:Uncharacterized protein n=1 Tax=Porphyra umbilicalis TaxID=2786 RepID=A0A1X6NZU1_PORUM|nr:hypothetical protein BU14_0312s0009 [Porphyra umbilicalis]|eukprot:OSX74055.1 hypothetical protein BU14_0312s0009 [Porphyra umbilicalis]